MINVAVIGTGGIARSVHLPGLRLCPQARIAALCDLDPVLLAATATEYGVEHTCSDYHEICADETIDAVVIATPNIVHKPIALAAIAAGKHVLLEKPLALNLGDAVEIWEAAEAAGVRHQTAFNYRFIPAMRYMRQLVGEGRVGQPYHLRAQRLQDWGPRAIGWRQHADIAGTGELGDMASHRLDYAHSLLGRLARVSGLTRQFVFEREGPHGPEAADVDDWSGILGEFANGATLVLESTKLAGGRGMGVQATDLLEINGSEGSLLYELNRPFELGLSGRLGRYEWLPVPRELLTVPGTTRNPDDGDAGVTSRYDQAFAFITAIAEDRPCTPSFEDGVRVQAVMDAVLRSASERRWVDVPDYSNPMYFT